jgi:serine phosphatase RsbU (regulator of sigma subunit)
VISEVNTMVSETGETSDIVTLWVGRYDPASDRLTWANGGHPPGLLRRGDGTYETLSVTGPLLGALSGATFEESSVAFGLGDRILLYTDGVTEARRNREFFGEERVREAFVAAGSAQDDARELLSAVRGFVRADLKDDVAVLVVSALGMQDNDDTFER